MVLSSNDNCTPSIGRHYLTSSLFIYDSLSSNDNCTPSIGRHYLTSSLFIYGSLSSNDNCTLSIGRHYLTSSLFIYGSICFRNICMRKKQWCLPTNFKWTAHQMGSNTLTKLLSLLRFQEMAVTRLKNKKPF